EHNRHLIEFMCSRLPEDRCVPASPLDPDRRGPFGCFTARSSLINRRFNLAVVVSTIAIVVGSASPSSISPGQSNLLHAPFPGTSFLRLPLCLRQIEAFLRRTADIDHTT